MSDIKCEGELPDVFSERLIKQIDTEHISKIVDMQQHMLVRFEKTNEMLTNFNILSASRYEAACLDFRRHCQLLTELKRDLDTAFKRIRALKSKLGRQYPNALKACGDNISILEDDEDEENMKTPVAKSAPVQMQASHSETCDTLSSHCDSTDTRDNTATSMSSNQRS